MAYVRALVALLALFGCRNLPAAEQQASADPTPHWALVRPQRPAVPHVKNRAWPKNAIDAFIASRLERAGLAPAPQADRSTLIRRLSFDLTGLPPASEEIEQFVRDRRRDAYEQLVARLLNSPRYGERWARHWLDVVRFAESNGFEMNRERKNAWPYRDYVIAAFNDDKPFDRFVLEQLAGDAFGAHEATAFLVAGPWDEVKSPDPGLTAQQRMDELHDIVSITATAFVGLTVGCARCHDHKFDPISQRDYYAMQALVAGVQHGEREVTPPDWDDRQAQAAELRREIAALDLKLEAFEPLAKIDVANNEPHRPAVTARLNSERFAPVDAKFVRFTIFGTAGGDEPCIDELEVFSAGAGRTNVALSSTGARPSASSAYPAAIHKLEHINDGVCGNSHSWISNERGRGWVQIELPSRARIDRIVWARDREEKFADRLATNYRIEVAVDTNAWTLIASSEDRVAANAKPPARQLGPAEAAVFSELTTRRDELATRLKPLSTKRRVYSGRFEQPGPTHRLHRGEATQKREEVAPGALTGIGRDLRLDAARADQERRLALAQWMVDPANPLTARVMVNRIWQHHFGRGIVDTPSDFGRMGGKPSHPELLDWLAVESIEHGWSIKALHTLIVTSATYRQCSAPQPKAESVDADNRLLWCFPRQRLEAEVIRDSILAVSGKLDLTMGGPGFDLFEPNDNYVKVYNPKREFGPAEFRRMIYQSKPRMRLDDTFGAFDCPDAGQTMPRRGTSTTPLQALNLLNAPFILQQAGFFADRLRNECSGSAPQQIRRAFALAYGRQPDRTEMKSSERFVATHGLEAFCRALLNSNELIFVF